MRIWKPAVVLTAFVTLTTGCTYAFTDPGVRATCGPLVFEVNDHGHDPAATTTEAVVAAFGRFGDLMGREVVFRGATTSTFADHRPSDPVLVELTWPDEAPPHLGFAEPQVVDGEYRSGWMLLHPTITAAPADLVHRLVLHELGHLHGLADVAVDDELMNPDLVVDDYGPGDIFGLIATHDGFCS